MNVVPPHNDSDPNSDPPPDPQAPDTRTFSPGSTPTPDLHPASTHARAPKTIGRYGIKRVIASGGMGTVYEATQESPRRVVALKVMKHGVASRSALRRFEYESQLLARLRHPGIAQVYDAGTHRDDSGTLPYFAMEYIPNAKSITDYARDKKLGTRARMKLFAQVCDAVHHGHQKGIIHRDLKPSNILVDSGGQVKVIDFGVARSTDSDLAVTTLQTDVGQLIGTLQYMSPEQCEADPHDIDTRSDVYALGVVFYELLAERLPYDIRNKAIHEATRAIRESNPTRLSTLNRTLRGDVETIALKALEKERDRRYQSATDFGQDIERYLNNEAITARRPSLGYQLRMLVRRNKPVFAAIGVVFVVLIAGIVVSTSQYLKAETARAASVQSRDDAEAVVKFLSDMLASADPRKQERDITVRAILDEAAATVEKKFATKPLIAARLHGVIATSYWALGLLDAAESHVEDAVTIFRRELDPEHPDALDLNNLVVAVLLSKGKIAEAEPMCRKNVEALRRAVGEEHPKTLTAMSNLASSLIHQGRFKEAETLERRLLEVQRRVLGEEHYNTLVSETNLGNALSQQGRFAEAEKQHRRTVETKRRVLGEEHPDTLISMINLCDALWRQGKYAEAEPMQRRTLEILRRVLGEEHPDTLKLATNLSASLYELGRYAEAEELARRSLEIGRRVLGEEHAQTLMSMMNLAGAFMSQGEYAEAEALYGKALEIQKRVLGEEHPNTLASMNNLANTLKFQGHYAEAERFYRQSLEGKRRVLGDVHVHTLNSMNNLADILNVQGDLVEAEAMFRATVETARSQLGNEHPFVAYPLEGLAAVSLKKGDPAEAEKHIREALAIFASSQLKNHPARAAFRSVLGECLTALGRYDDAESLVLEGYDRLKASEGAKGYETLKALRRIVKLYETWDQAEPGKGYAEKAAELRAKLLEVESSDTPSGRAPAPVTADPS